MSVALTKYDEHRSIKKIIINYDILYTIFMKWYYEMWSFRKGGVKRVLTIKG